MKTNRFLLLLSFLLFCQFANIQAQQNLQKWITKCESAPSVDMTYINTRHPETKKLERKVVQASFKNNPALLKEMMDAYNKDKENAYRVAEKKVNGIIRPDYCRFMEKDSEVRFLFEFGKNDEVSVTMNIYYNDADGKTNIPFFTGELMNMDISFE